MSECFPEKQKGPREVPGARRRSGGPNPFIVPACASRFPGPSQVELERSRNTGSRSTLLHAQTSCMSQCLAENQ